MPAEARLLGGRPYRWRRVIGLLLVPAALTATTACGGRGAAAARFVEEVGVIAKRESVPPAVSQRAVDVLQGAGQRADDEGTLGQAVALACRANGYVPVYGTGARVVISQATVDQDVKDRADEIFDQIDGNQKVAELICKVS